MRLDDLSFRPVWATMSAKGCATANGAMAKYFLHVKVFSRGQGSRVTRAAAYRAGERIRDERTSEVYNYWRARSLERRKRFQIRAGFIFERAVAEALKQQGFEVQGIKRINHHEFDVVTLRQDVIWNVQCKDRKSTRLNSSHLVISYAVF